MTSSTSDERAERLTQELVGTPAGERIRMKCGAADLRSVITDILSLLDSEAAGERDFEWALRELADGWINAFQREGPHGFNQNARRVLEFIANDAATSMRDLCVEKVRTLTDGWLKWAIEDVDAERSGNLRLSYNVAQNIIIELESVALQEQEKLQRNAAAERCLRQVKIMRVNWEHGMRWPNQGDLLDELISRLESLTLEQEQKTK